MKTVKAETPGGETWGVRVVWQPRWSALVRRFGAWRRKRRGEKGSGDVGDLSGCGNADGCGGDDLGAIVFRRALETRDDIAAKLTQGFPAPVVGTLRTRPSGPPPD